jgi:alanine racemase
VGDEVVMIGTQNGETLSADELAGMLGTINYEIVSAIMARVPRIYVG